MSMLIAIGVILNIVESIVLIPLPIPGVKIGIANIIGIITLYTMGISAFLSVNSLRVLVASLLAGYFLSNTFMMSVSGLIFSSLMMIVIFRYSKLSIYSVSMLGAYFHIIGQVIMASWLYQTKAFLYYMPYLLLISIFSGLVIARIASFIIKKMYAANIFSY